jgi:hypothetical protein
MPIVFEQLNLEEHDIVLKISDALLYIHVHHLKTARINLKMIHTIKQMLDINSNLLGAILRAKEE